MEAKKEARKERGRESKEGRERVKEGGREEGGGRR